RTSRFAALALALAVLAGLYALGVFAGFVTFAALFKSGVLKGIGALFFRGLVLAGISFIILFALLAAMIKGWGRHGLNSRDAFCAAVLSLSFNICFLVVAPVTVDRSVSIFMLGEMAAHPEQSYATDDMSRRFVDVYIGDYQQIGRRLREQTEIGNVAEAGGHYRISRRGQDFIAISKFVSWLFDTDPRLVSPRREAGPLKP
ncbi:MAG: hypothetical protein P4L76_18425, partial [Beijerinckiaceae bacterium]|nr:hypothetical protein [Beijerinckiaceae bacterium]